MEDSRKYNYRNYVGPQEKYDLIGAMQFNLLTFFGLRETHKLLDIGCGSLRGGRLFIPYLLAGNYYGIEPNDWLIREGIKNNVGRDLCKTKQPSFNNNNEFDLSIFGDKFDFILAQSIFSHSSEYLIRKCLFEAKNVMDQCSIFLATYIDGETNYLGSGWVYPGCVKYTFEKIRSLAIEQGLECTKLKWLHPNGQTWVAIYYPDNDYVVKKCKLVTKFF